MKTLIIHPADKSTDFLRPIYQSLQQYTIVTGGTKRQVNELIKSHDRIMMMGHGSSNGLFSVGKFDGTYVIDFTTVSLLRNKECVFIWCNADRFVNAYNLKGLYSGMFVSEVHEAIFMGIGRIPQSLVNESNDLFAEWLGEGIHRDLYHAYHRMMNNYEQLAEYNAVAKYNSDRLYLVL